MRSGREGIIFHDVFDGELLTINQPKDRHYAPSSVNVMGPRLADLYRTACTPVANRAPAGSLVEGKEGPAHGYG